MVTMPSWANLDATWILGSTRVYRNNRDAVEDWRDLQLPRRHEPSTADSWDFPKSRSPKPHGGEVVSGSRSVIARCMSARRRATKARVVYAVRDLSAWRQRLVATGAKIEEGVAIPGYERFEFRDP